jgi:hypothetical protein
MRGKNYNAGLRGVLFEAQHYEKMGSALWLFGWLVLRQTHETGSIGWVLGGKAISYREIEQETGFNPRTLERWMQTLRRCGYVQTDATPAGMIVRILKAKKFPQHSQRARKSADSARKHSEVWPQSRGAEPPELFSYQEAAQTIGSSSVDAFIEKQKPFYTQTNCQSHNFESAAEILRRRQKRLNPSEQPQMQDREASQETPHAAQTPSPSRRTYIDARLRQQLLRAERDEAVRRELAVGSGPEGTRR